MLFWLWSHLAMARWNVQSVSAAWPSSKSSGIQLLGLFPDGKNISDTTNGSIHSRAMFKAAVFLSQQYNITVDGEFIQSQASRTGRKAIDALSYTCQAVTNKKTLGVVGPASSRESPIIAAFAEKVGIPVVSYAATDPDLSDRENYRAFHRTVPSDYETASAIAKLFIRYNWTSCVIIHQNDAYGSGGANVIGQTFLASKLIVDATLLFDIVTKSIRGNLRQFLVTSATRIVIVWLESRYASLVLQTALDANVVGPHFIWLLSARIPFHSFNATFHQNLIGLLAIEPVTGAMVSADINRTLLDAALNVWEQHEPESFPGPGRVDYYASFAFDATWSLIQSLQRLCSATINSSLTCSAFTTSEFCFDRRFEHADALLDVVSTTEFLGVSGPVRFRADVTDRINGSYFQVQNVQLFSNTLDFVPILDYSDAGDWTMHNGNVITWPGVSLEVPTGRAILNGVTLRIGIIESPPFVTILKTTDAAGKNSTTYTGYILDLIECLRIKLNFTPDIQLAPSNQTYEGLIEAVVTDYYDIVVGDVTVTANRRELVGFSNAIFDNSLCILIRKTTDVDIDLLSFLRPLSRNLWSLLLGVCLVAGVLVCLVERRHNAALVNRSISSQMAMSTWYSFGTIVGYGVEFGAITAAGRLITASLYILSLILVASYTANLASDLTLSKSKSMISGIDDLKNGKIPLHRIGIIPGTAQEDYYVREISKGIRNYYKVASHNELYESLLTGIIDAALVDSGSVEYVTNNLYCNLSFVPEDFEKGVFGIVTLKEWLYAKDLDVAILSLRESGTLNHLRQRWFQAKRCPTSTESLLSTAIGIERTAGLFLTLGLITVLSLLLLAWIERHAIKNRLLILMTQRVSTKERRRSKEAQFQDYQPAASNFTRL